MKQALLFLLLFLYASVLLARQKEASSSTKNSDSSAQTNPIEKIDEFRYRIGNVTLDSKKRELSIPGMINMEKGVVELLACARGGKTHESILVLDIIPYHLQVSLLLLGLKYRGGVEYQGDPKIPKGDSVEVWVTWKGEGAEKTVRGEDLVWNITEKKSMEHTPWIFVGSKMIEGRFMADQEKSLITTYHDPFTIFDNPSPDGANDDLYKVNEQIVPAKGTPVTITIKALR